MTETGPAAVEGQLENPEEGYGLKPNAFKTYRMGKTVTAAQIIGLTAGAYSHQVRLLFEHDTWADIQRDSYLETKPTLGDYFVVWDDGVHSILKQQFFEDRYQLQDEPAK